MQAYYEGMLIMTGDRPLGCLLQFVWSCHFSCKEQTMNLLSPESEQTIAMKDIMPQR